MGSGGARVRSGPPPDPSALRRDRDGAGWVLLPSEGREGDPPEWPLTRSTGRTLARERYWWARLWESPQAVQWDRLGQVVEVALYVRRLVQAERPAATAAITKEARILADSLGLTIPGMLRLRWRIAVDEVAAKRAEKADRPAPRRSARDRMNVVDDDAAGEAAG
jgi:hypothetical protein